MKEILYKLFEHDTLDKETARQILIDLANGKFNHSQVAAFLTVYMMRSITVDELEGFRDAMLELCLPVEIDEYNAIDLCGTGGDGRDTFNISTPFPMQSPWPCSFVRTRLPVLPGRW